MRKGIQKFLILLAVFIVALFGFSKLTNHETKDLTTDLVAPTLPVVYFEDNDHLVNELHGYVKEMSVISMRDTITPLLENGKLSLRIDPYDNKISKVTFQIRSLNGDRLVQDGEVQVSGDKSAMTGTISVENLLQEQTEYQLILQVTVGEQTSYYYTRIMEAGKSQIDDCVDFVEEFHAITMDKERQSELSSYMEPSSAADNTTLQKVTINNSLSQACWGDFVGTEVTAPVVSIKEMNDDYQVILLEYIMSSVGDNGESEYYNVEEYYRVRVGAEKIYLLSFERTMEEIFRGEGNQISKDTIDLGIRSEDVSYKTNETGNVICFVQQGELWSYNQIENSLTRVFSFRSQEGMDIRENYQEHDIRILRVDEGGSLDFVVYGYMNCGEHEGQVGVSVCHYDGVTNTVEEMLFVPTTLSYEIVKEQIGKLMYVSDSGVFYLTVSNQVYRIQMDSRKAEVYIDGLKSDMLVNSEDGRYIAWSEDGTTMHVTDLEKGDSFDIQANGDQILKPLGFLGSDCIYGWGYRTNIFSTQTRTDTLALSQVLIVDTSDSTHSVLKTYEAPGVYVTDIRIQDGSIYLSRVMKDGDTYVDTTEDTIMNRDLQEKDQVSVDSITSDVKQKEVVLKLLEETSGSAPRTVIPKLIENEESNTLEMKNLSASSAYYVYAKGKVLLATDDMAAAVQSADANKGVVIGSDLLYVWRLGQSQTQEPLTIE
ncbi:hypothetical protein [uncultured Eubacterium sp.]|uniref:hypothetical protein n=1 Tax=uncultured Eubacterium sp. TaxID=165185 RepID=UPI0025F69CB5|nr:hypothetical protein [uncultured Eubacterium sp.]MCI6538213.1 hypothetical protein [Lachnospiraceae bacterium]